MFAYRLLTSSRPFLNTVPARSSRTLLLVKTPTSLRVSSTTATAVRHYTSPVKAFIDVFKEQLKKNKDIQQNIKQLQDETGKMAESDTLKRAKEVFEKAKEGTASTTHIGAEKFKQASETISKAASQVGETVSQTFKEASEAEFVKETQEKLKRAGETVSKAAEPLTKNPVVGKISESVKTVAQDSSGRYTGYVDKETRRKLRKKAASGDGPGNTTQGHHSRHVEADPNAGSSIVIHKDSAWKESWNNFKENNSFIQGVFRAGKSYQESDNIFISYTRAFTDRVQDTFGSLFEESDQAQAIKALQLIDPRFNMESFMKEARGYIIPELLDAYLKSDFETLREWCSEAVSKDVAYSVLTGVAQAQMQENVVSDCKILDLRDVDRKDGLSDVADCNIQIVTSTITRASPKGRCFNTPSPKQTFPIFFLLTAKILDNDVPVLVLSFRTQEVILFRDGNTGMIKYGKEDHIEQVTYACVLTKHPDDVQNPITSGWRVMEMAKYDSRPTW
ncbi:hypothetical protein BC938DRAFT_473643 [Jimgerdemannia flammicorona]|uniref:Mitochondrial import inner membrane translocase subunit TIM44 n=1 Tax=Jimgerdemannia flammicorona TaxID=994334 RepID=A0A433QT54_9FUNG|nr:hypothetical protein BC938DRAFT_473643 [Jimgerdemannia flammicorona]